MKAQNFRNILEFKIYLMYNLCLVCAYQKAVCL